MKDIFCSWRVLTKAMMVIAVTTLLPEPLVGQTTDLQVMVSGPWSFVEDPHDSTRVVVIAPISDTHDTAELFPGDDAAKFKGQRRLEPGVFRLEISNRVNIQKASSSNPYRLQETAGIKVDVKAVVEPAIYKPSMPRFAVSLPKPDFYETYASKGTSQSIISKNAIVNATGVTDYTTWMVLHYAVTSITPANLTGTSDDGSVKHNDDIKFASSVPGGNTLAISIVTMAKDDFSGWRCDSYSYESFKQTKMLRGGLPLYTLFPSLDLTTQGQRRDDFHYDCPQVLSERFLKARSEYRTTLDRIGNIGEYLKNPQDGRSGQAKDNWLAVKDAVAALYNEHLPKDVEADFKAVDDQFKNVSKRTRLNERDSKFEPALTRIAGDVHIVTAGGGDCHAAQFSINGVIP